MELNWRLKHSMSTEVGPVIASSWLTYHNKHNRYVRESVVDQYARDMVTANWVDTGEPIVFDWNGQIINGQHRLMAIVKSATTQVFTVTTGMDPQARAYVDTHSKRNTRDAFDGAGKGQLLGDGSVSQNTAAGMWSRMRHGIVYTKGHETRAELIQFANRYPEGGLFALECFGKHKRVGSVVVSPVLAAVARAYYHYESDPELVRLGHFCEVLATGIQSDSNDRTVITFRETLLAWKGKNSNASAEIYGKASRAIQAFMGDYPLTKFYMPIEEPFPLPDRSPASSATSTDLIDRMAQEHASVNVGGNRNDRLVGVASH